MSGLFDVFTNFDLNVFHWFETTFNTGNNKIFDTIMYIITTLGDAGIIWIVLAAALMIPKKYRKCGMMMAGSLIIMLVLNNLVLKNLFQRPRPFLFFENNPLYNFPDIVARDTLASSSNPTGYEYSFPSGHTTSSFAAVVPLFKRDKRFGAAALVIAILIAFSRIYVHVHYCTDILFGVVLGVVYGLLGCLVIGLIIKLVESKKPKLAAKIFG